MAIPSLPTPGRLLTFVFLFLIVSTATYLGALFDLFLLALYLLTSYATGSFLCFSGDSRPLLRHMLRLFGGVGLLSFGLWFVTLWRLPLREIVIYSTGLIYLRRHHIRQALRDGARTWRVHEQGGLPTLITAMFLTLFFLVFASPPISGYDSLATHLRVISRIVFMEKYDYNVLESLVFAATDLLMHMGGVWLMLLGGTKALTYLVSTLALGGIGAALLLLRKKFATPWVSPPFLLLLFGLTPLSLQLSTVLYQDICPLPFLLLALAYSLRSPARMVARNLPSLFLLLGLALFAKKTAFYMVAPLVGLILVRGIASLRGDWKEARRFLLRLCLSLPLLLLIAGPLLVVWHKTANPIFPFANLTFKSHYFPQSNFSDPFTNSLAVNVHSLFSIVFHTSRNIELLDTGLGFHLLALPAAILIFFVRRDIFGLTLSALCLLSFAISVKATNNIRYFTTSIVLAMAIVVYAFDCLTINIKRHILLVTIMTACVLIFILPLFPLLVNPQFPDGYRAAYNFIRTSRALDASPLRGIAAHIPPGAFVLWATVHPLVGACNFHVYTVSWHNSWLSERLHASQESFDNIIAAFDYLLVDSCVSSQILSERFINAATKATQVSSNNCLTLYRIQKQITTSLEIDFGAEGVEVTVGKPLALAIPHLTDKMYAAIDAEPVHAGQPPLLGRFQVNCTPLRGGGIIPFLNVFELKASREMYQHVFHIPNAQELTGVWILASHDLRPIRIFKAKIESPIVSVLQNALYDFGRKWPSLGNFNNR